MSPPWPFDSGAAGNDGNEGIEGVGSDGIDGMPIDGIDGIDGKGRPKPPAFAAGGGGSGATENSSASAAGPAVATAATAAALPRCRRTARCSNLEFISSEAAGASTAKINAQRRIICDRAAQSIDEQCLITVKCAIRRVTSATTRLMQLDQAGRALGNPTRHSSPTVSWYRGPIFELSSARERRIPLGSPAGQARSAAVARRRAGRWELKGCPPGACDCHFSHLAASQQPVVA